MMAAGRGVVVRHCGVKADCGSAQHSSQAAAVSSKHVAAGWAAAAVVAVTVARANPDQAAPVVPPVKVHHMPQRVCGLLRGRLQSCVLEHAPRLRKLAQRNC